MRVVVEIQSGSTLGQKILLRAGQSIRIGRSALADVEIPWDGHMSGIHFALSVSGQSCRLEDLQSTNGTRCNGEYIREALLLDGDQIQAGDTDFLVRIDDGLTTGQVAGSVTPTARTTHVVVPDESRLRRTDKLPAPIDLQCAAQLGDWLQLRTGQGVSPAVADATVTDAVARLCQGLKIHWLVDVRRLDRSLAAPLEPRYLFDWLHPQVASIASPRIVLPPERPDQTGLATEWWGRNAVLGFVTRMESEPFIHHLRWAARGFASDSPSAEPQAWGFYWPHIMRSQLASPPSSQLEQLLADVDCVVLETEQRGLQLHARANFLARLDNLGFHIESCN